MAEWSNAAVLPATKRGGSASLLGGKTMKAREDGLYLYIKE